MIEWFLGILATNSVAQGVFAGALAAAPMTALIWVARDLPRKIFAFIKRQLSQELIVFSYVDNYYEIVDFARSFIIWTKSHQINDDYDGEGHALGVGIGTHYGKYKGVFFKISKEQQDSQGVQQFKEQTTITFFTRKKSVKEEFFEEARKVVKEDTSLKVRENEGSHWGYIGELAPRPYESVISRHKEEAYQHIQKFRESEEQYLNKGIPYHTGILLHGIPGTGKTSIIHALANKLGVDVHYLNPATVMKGSLMSLLSGTWRNKILVIEDIDVSGTTVSRDEKSEMGMTLSELLNCLDGIATPHGMVTIATTNRIDSLDPALIRPGRFDKLIEVGKLSEEEAQEMAVLFEAELPKPYTPMTGVELRNYFIKNNS